MFARLSAHWPNLCDVLVNVMLGVMVLLIMACGGQDKHDWPAEHALNSLKPQSEQGGLPLIRIDGSLICTGTRCLCLDRLVNRKQSMRSSEVS